MKILLQLLKKFIVQGSKFSSATSFQKNPESISYDEEQKGSP